jgi:hypothetical protein
MSFPVTGKNDPCRIDIGTDADDGILPGIRRNGRAAHCGDSFLLLVKANGDVTYRPEGIGFDLEFHGCAVGTRHLKPVQNDGLCTQVDLTVALEHDPSRSDIRPETDHVVEFEWAP